MKSSKLGFGRALLAPIIGVVARLWIASLRFERRGPPMEGPSLVAFWHGDQLPLLGQRPRGQVVAPISLSRDGRMQARIMKHFGIGDVPGSSSRGAFGAARGLLRALQGGAVALMAVDGPRGPRGHVKTGVAFLARHAKVPVYPVGVASGLFKRLGAWDRFLLPLPFSRVVVWVGTPMRLEAGLTDAQAAADIGRQIRAAEVAARGCLNKREP